MTYTFTLQLDTDRRRSPERFARAIARVIAHACEVDIAGAEVLDSDVGQVTVRPVRTPRAEPQRVRQTACRHCGQDIEGWAPYRRGEWRDRGGNSKCVPYRDRDGEIVQPRAGQTHAPVLEGRG